MKAKACDVIADACREGGKSVIDMLGGYTYPHRIVCMRNGIDIKERTLCIIFFKSIWGMYGIHEYNEEWSHLSRSVL
jgi:hypothetical protein